MELSGYPVLVTGGCTRIVLKDVRVTRIERSVIVQYVLIFYLCTYELMSITS